MLVLLLVLGLGVLMLICVIGLLVLLLCGDSDSQDECLEGGAPGFSAIAQNPEFMAAIGKSFANQTATLSRMVEEEENFDLIFECSSCHFVQNEESMSYSDNTCPHCGSTMYRNR